MPGRRRFLSSLGSTLGGAALGAALGPAAAARPRADGVRPNVLFLSVDDINDWIGVYGGHPDAHTPHLDALAGRSTRFTRAYASVPLCYPSRIATMTGLRPSTSGVFTASKGWRERIPDAVHLPAHFRAHGYETISGGKVYHWTDKFGDPGESWVWDHLLPAQRQAHSWHDGSLNGLPDARNFDWGTPEGVPDTQYIDHITVDWLLEKLATPRPRPFFMGAGIYRPHLPWYAPKRFFDRFPPATVALPPTIAGDLDDVPQMGLDMVERFNRTDYIAENQVWADAVAAYLACISWADHQVGRLLDGLAASPHADTTIVVLWSDHGYHLGEKLHWSKNALWEEATRIPLMVHVPEALGGPGAAPGERVSGRTVELVDLFPTLTELCGLPTPPDLDGQSLAPLLDDPEAPWDRPALSTWLPRNHSLRTERYRLIQYRDGGEELYDHEVDPMEWTNLALDPAFDGVRDALRARLPATNWGGTDAEPEPGGEPLELSSYPNPSGGPITVEFYLREPSPVSVTVFALDGRRLRVLADAEPFAPGRGEVVWDGRDAAGATLPGGMYLCVVRTARASETRRLVLLP